VELAILARHGESAFSARAMVNGDVAVACPLTAVGEEEARRLGEAIARDPIDLCVTSEFERTLQTAELALAGRDVPRLVVPELNDPRYGEFEGGPLPEYRAWAHSVGSAEPPPGDGESRRDIVARYARGFGAVLERPEETVLVVVHSLPIAYVLAGGVPRVAPIVEHATAYRFSADELGAALGRLQGWLAAPTW
jgi:2,3-bisphosphoglycerate-dependent phosphoglycerate mutase